MKTANMSIYIISCIFMLLCALVAVQGCAGDSDTYHTTAERATMDYSYTSNNPVKPSTKDELKFMTFNQRSGFHWSCKSDPKAQAVFMRQVDYVGTQETVQNVDTRCNGCNIPKIIADEAGFSTYFAKAIPWRTGQYGLSAGTSQEIIERRYIPLPSPGYETRVAVALKTRPPALRGNVLWFINIHIEYYNTEVRVAQINKILDDFIQKSILATDPKALIVMTGDFNGGPWDTVYGIMKNAGFVNTWERFNGTIFGGNTMSAWDPASRFDHIWFRTPEHIKVTVQHAEVPNVLLSDHRPYIATLKFDFVESVSTESVVCVGPIYETIPSTSVFFKCPSASQTIQEVQFASYGTPEGSCNNFKLGNCIGGSSVAVVKDKCLNRNSCSFPIANNVFGDPCSGVGKRFVAQVLCK